MLRAAAASALLPLAAGHGMMTTPPSVSGIVPGMGCGGHCWYENGTMIPGEPTIDEFSPLKTAKNCPGTKLACEVHDGPGNSVCCYANAGVAPGKGVDTTRKAPWRAPGSAPITSPCGIQGGNPQGCPRGNRGTGGCMTGGYGHGTDGRTLLNRGPAATAWKAGGVETVEWRTHNNHGGGYSYRLCPKAKNPMEMTEECFQKTPLDFVGKTSVIRYFTGAKRDLEIPALQTTEGTTPKGSMWRKNPIPYCVGLTAGPSQSCPLGAQFKPPVKGTPEGYGPFDDWVLSDKIRVPNVPTGDYVVSWRWDCEEFYPGQVWTTCANVRITNSGPVPPPAPPPSPPAAQKYACKGNTCVAAASGGDLKLCQSACGNQ